MPIEIKWTDADPITSDRRYLRAEKYAKRWTFSFRAVRRSVWEPLPPTRAMWEHVLDALERRYRRREGVTDADLADARRELAKFPPDEEE